MQAQRVLQKDELCSTNPRVSSTSVTCALNHEIYPLTNSQSARCLLTGRKWDPVFITREMIG